MEIKSTKLNLSFSIMMILLSLILLWISESINHAGFLLLFLLLIPSEMLILEKKYFSAFLNVILPGFFILILPFSHYKWFFFISVIGWYSPIRFFLSRFRAPWIGSLLSFLFCNIAFASFLFILSYLSIQPIKSFDLFWRIVILVFCEIAFALLDVVYQLFQKMYTQYFRRYIIQ